MKKRIEETEERTEEVSKDDEPTPYSAEEEEEENVGNKPEDVALENDNGYRYENETELWDKDEEAEEDDDQDTSSGERETSFATVPDDERLHFFEDDAIIKCTLLDMQKRAWSSISAWSSQAVSAPTAVPNSRTRSVDEQTQRQHCAFTTGLEDTALSKFTLANVQKLARMMQTWHRDIREQVADFASMFSIQEEQAA